MKRRYIKILSIVMIMVMLLSVTTTSALAAETGVGKGEQQLFMEQLGFETKTLAFATETTEKFSFVTPEGIDSVVEKVVLSNGDIVYDVTEGDVTDVLVLKPNGDIYLDGNLVKIVKETMPMTESMATGDATIMPRAQRHEFTTVCPYGTAAQYYTLTDYEREVLLLEQAVKDITIYVFTQLIVAAMGMIAPGCNDLVEELFGFILDQIEAYNPVADAFSMQYYRYVHGTNGFTVTNNMSVAKYVMGFYKDLNYNIPIYVNGTSSIVSYEVFTY